MKLSIVPTIEEASRPDHGSALQQLGRRLFLAKLAQFREGELTDKQIDAILKAVPPLFEKKSEK